MSSITISHVAKSYAGQDILNDVSFTINSHEKVGLLGKNGSGKSTLFKIITGDEEQDSGEVTILPRSAEFGYLPQTLTDPKLDSLSSGEKVKEHLSKLLDASPDILILDEPTNHLDWPTLDWLEEVIKQFSGPVLLTSHDRMFLDNVVNKILELENGKIQIYGGNYSFYRAQKEIQENAQAQKYYEQQSRVKKLTERARVLKTKTQQLEIRTSGTDHYQRRKAAKAASSAINIERRIAKELIETKVDKPEPNWELKALFNPRVESGQTVVNLKAVNVANRLKDINLLIQRGQRVGLVGKNGSGKTTLVKIILDEITPDSGEVLIGNNVLIGYLSQTHQELNSDRLVIDELISTSVDKTAAYKLLHRFLLPSDKINQPVQILSSGEKAKLLLAKIMTSGANFIILDEPTNHLDIPSREAIEQSLSDYNGTLLIVSHDRYFLQNVGITDYFLVDRGTLSKLN